MFIFALVLRLEEKKVYGGKSIRSFVCSKPADFLWVCWRGDEILWGLICCCTLQEHLQQCLFESVPCTNDGCCDHILRKDLEEHLSRHCKFREEMCQYCNKHVVLVNIKVRMESIPWESIAGVSSSCY